MAFFVLYLEGLQYLNFEGLVYKLYQTTILQQLIKPAFIRYLCRYQISPSMLTVALVFERTITGNKFWQIPPPSPHNKIMSSKHYNEEIQLYLRYNKMFTLKNIIGLIVGLLYMKLSFRLTFKIYHT